MIPFKPITIESKETITSFTFSSPYQNCDFSFANMCSWQFYYKSEYAVVEHFLILRFQIGKGRTVYMLPVGAGDKREIIHLMEKDSLATGHHFRIMGVSGEGISELENSFPRQFKYIPERNYFDYIYYRNDLAELTGKKYQTKRNHINRFRNKYKFEYLPITPDIVPLCIQLEDLWYKNNNISETDEDLYNERYSMIFTLKNMESLGVLGGAIFVDGEIVAFALGSPINHNTFDVHTEKANTKFDGIYSVINQLFAMHIPEQFIYVNREEDLGIEGLRKAKLSYHPAFLLEKNVAIKNG